MKILTIKPTSKSALDLLDSLSNYNPSLFLGFTPNNIKISHHFSARLNRYLTPEEFCCRAGHLQILKEFLDSGEEYCMVLEDDVFLRRDSSYLKIMLKNLNDCSVNTPNEHLCILGCQDGLEHFKFIYGREITSNIKEVPHLYTRFLWRAGSYFINRSTAKKVIELHNDYVSVIDDWKMLSDYGVVILYSDLFGHPTDLTHSSLEANRAKLRPRKKNILTSILRFIIINLHAWLFRLKKL